MIEDTVERIVELGLECRHVDGEFRVGFDGGSELSAYYTPDPADALEAAKAMRDLAKGLT
jgi:hypothetical protein